MSTGRPQDTFTPTLNPHPVWLRVRSKGTALMGRGEGMGSQESPSTTPAFGFGSLSSGGWSRRGVLRNEHINLPLCVGTTTVRFQAHACQPEAGWFQKPLSVELTDNTSKPPHPWDPWDLPPTWPIILGPIILDDGVIQRRCGLRPVSIPAPGS